MKSFEEIFAERQAKTAKRHGMTVEEMNEKLNAEANGDQDKPVNNDDGQSDILIEKSQNAVDKVPTEDNQKSDDTGEDLRAKIANLESQLASMKGRVIPEQQRAAALENTLSVMENQYKSQLAALQEKLDSANRMIEEQRLKDFSIDDILSDEEKETIDPSQLAIVKKVAAVAARQFAPKYDVDAKVKELFEQERAARINAYRNDALLNPKNPASRLQELSRDPAFMAWVDNNTEVRYATTALLNANSTVDVDKALNVLNKCVRNYDEQTSAKKSRNQKTDAVTASLESAMRRGPQEKNESQRREEFLKMSQRLKELSRSGKRNSEEARALYEKIQSF